jgi:hypothetical protein
MYEFSTVMAVAAVLAANFYNGLNTYAWNWWVLGARQRMMVKSKPSHQYAEGHRKSLLPQT